MRNMPLAKNTSRVNPKQNTLLYLKRTLFSSSSSPFRFIWLPGEVGRARREDEHLSARHGTGGDGAVLSVRQSGLFGGGKRECFFFSTGASL